MKRNIFWLALHGGGGTGSGGGSSDIYGTITVRINNATISDNADVTISDKKAVVEYEITSKNPRLVYNLRMSLDGKVIHTNNNIIPNISSQTNSYEITAREFNSTGNRPKLSIQIYDTTENNFTFFNCNLVLTSLSLNVFNQTPDFTDRDSATLTFSVLSNITNQEHSVYVSTNPKLDTETYLDIDSAEEGSALRKLRHTYTVNQANSSYSVSFKYVDILPNITLGSSGTIYAFVRLSSDTSGSVKSKLYSIQYTWISSNEVVIQPVSPIVNLDNPASIIKSSVLSVSFIPYLQSSNGYGNCSIKATEGIITDGVFSASKASYTLSEEGELSCKFNEVKNVSYSDFASIDYFELGKLYRIEIQCTSTATNQTGIGYTYIFISTVSTNFLNVSDDNKLIFSLKAFQSSVNLNSDTLVQPFIFGQVTGKIKATLNSYNFGANSGNEGTYIRYSNKAHSVISNIRFEPEVENSIDYSKVKLFSSGISGISSGEYGIINNDNPEFSISVSFLADKKNTSDKIIFSFGDITKNSGDKSGYTGTGILITNHKYVVRLKSKVTGDITVLSGVLIDGNFINLTFVFNDNSAFKVYKNGVLLKVVALNSSPISEGQNIPLYTTILWELANFNTFKINHYNNSGTRNVNDYAEINLYNVSMYSTALNARECVCDYINNYLTIHPTENANAFISNSKMKFQSGLGVTNMSFSTSNSSYTFKDTKCTTFDVYYILYNIGTATNLEGLFWGTTNCAFIYDKDELYINSMHRNTFINCGNVTNLIYAFRGTGTRQFLYSPKHTGGNGTSSTETSTLTDNNGLFTPLIKCTSIGAAFYGCYYVIDRFLFRRNDDEKFSITDMTFFEPAAIIDDTNAMDQHEGNISLSTAASIWDAITGTPSSMTGKLWGFFKDFKGMSTTNSAIEDPVGMFYGTSYINFDTLRGDNNQIPVRGSIQSCFNLKYASGELLLNELFKYPSLITALNSSFIIDNSLSNSSNNCTIKFTDDTFSAFINIREISYKVDGDLAKSAKSGSSFAGAGINKIIENSFPENIFQGLTNLKRVTALFTDCTFNNFNSSNSVLNLPGKVFANLHNLEEIDYLFYNFKTKTIKVNLTIEGGGFSSCVNLKSLRYLFAGTNNSTELLVTNTSIPYKLFYHGEKPVSTTFIGTAQEYYTESYATYSKNTITSSSVVLESEKVNNKVSILTFSGITNVDTSNKTFECTPTSLVTIRERVYNNDEDYDESTIWSGQYGNWENTKVIVSTEDFTYTVPNKSITNMEGCFSYSNIKPYVNVSPKPENNEYYNPYTYIKASNGVWNKATQNLHKETMIWEYDGFNLPASIDSLSIDDIYKKFDTCEYLDDIVYKFKNQQVDNTLYTITAPNITVCETTTTSDWHFATPPDLLRYCTSDAIIDKLFYGSGPEKNGDSKHTSFSQLVESGAQDNIPGLRGRICPYMLKPLPKLKSIKGLFAYCGLLTAYKLNKEKAYKIPKSFFYYTPEVTDLQEAFRNFEFPIDGTVNVFSSLTGLLNIKYIFLYSLWGGTATNQFDWSNTFSKNNVENVIACFSTNVYDGTYYSPINFKSAQYVNIGNNVFKTNTNYLDAKYVFSGYSNSTVSISSPLQLPQSDYNYASGNSANSVYTN